MKLIDTSLWVHALRRKGDPAKRERVAQLLGNGEAAWCPPIRLELWNGVGSDEERKILREFEAILPDLEINGEVWKEACLLSVRCRKAGKSVPSLDVLISACARHHGLDVAHADAHFDLLASLA